MMDWVIVLGIVVAGLGLSAFFSGAETGMYSLSRLRVHLADKRGDSRGRRLARMLEDETGALSTTLIGTNTMNYITSAAVAYLFTHLLGFRAFDVELYTVVVLTPIVFVFGEIVPKNLFQLHTEHLMMRSSWPLEQSYRLCRLSGLLWLFKTFSGMVGKLVGRRGSGRGGSLAPKRRVSMMLQDALVGHALGDAQSSLIHGVVQLSDLAVHSVMVPLNKIVSIHAGAGRRELIRFARRWPHAQLPVFESRRRHIIGVIAVDDLLGSDAWQTVGERLSPVSTIRSHETVPAAIARLQLDRRDMAIVVNRGGQMLGLVTLRDLLAGITREVDVLL